MKKAPVGKKKKKPPTKKKKKNKKKIPRAAYRKKPLEAPRAVRIGGVKRLHDMVGGPEPFTQSDTVSCDLRPTSSSKPAPRDFLGAATCFLCEPRLIGAHLYEGLWAVLFVALKRPPTFKPKVSQNRNYR